MGLDVLALGFVSSEQYHRQRLIEEDDWRKWETNSFWVVVESKIEKCLNSYKNHTHSGWNWLNSWKWGINKGGSSLIIYCCVGFFLDILLKR